MASCSHELREDAEQDVVLARHVDRVAGGVSALPVGAEQRLPTGQDFHPVGDLGSRRDPDGLAEVARTAAGKLLDLARW